MQVVTGSVSGCMLLYEFENKGNYESLSRGKSHG